MTDQPTYLTIRVDWLTSVPAFLSGLTDSQTYPTIYPYWNLCIVIVLSAAYQCMFITLLHIRTDSLLPLFCLLFIISVYLSGPTDYLSGRLTDQHPVTYVYIFGLTAFQSDWPSCLCSYPAYLSGLTSNLHICLPICAICLPFLPYISRLTNWPMYLSTSLGWLLPNLPVGADWPTNIPVYL